MTDERKLSATIKEQIINFADKITSGLKKPTKKFVAQMLFGILAAKDVKLSNIARSLGEQIPLIKTENRLSRQTKSNDLTKTITQLLIANGAPLIKSDTVLAIDISEITKEYASAMEYLALVRNGSSRDGALKRGYWLIGVLAADVKGDSFVPLLADLYSQAAFDFESENQKILAAVDLVCEGTKGKGIWAMDRGGDRKRLIEGLLRRGQRFVIRLDGDRNLIWRNGDKRQALAIALGVRCEEEIEIVVEGSEGRLRRQVKIGKTKVKLPGVDEVLTLVVVKGFGSKPLMLLSNVNDKMAQEILEIYLTRWKCDESYRFLKAGYNLEDVRVRSYGGLRNIVVLLLAVFHFLAVNLGERLRLRVLLKKILEKAKRFFQIPEFKFYALADGIYRVLFKSGFSPPIRKEVKDVGQQVIPFMR